MHKACAGHMSEDLKKLTYTQKEWSLWENTIASVGIAAHVSLGSFGQVSATFKKFQ